MHGKLYHMGFRGRVARSTLADANESRDWRIYADFAQVLRHGTAVICPRPDRCGLGPDSVSTRQQSTSACRCFRGPAGQHKAAVKMHTLLDLHGNIPAFIRTGGKVHDVNILDEFLPEAGAFYVMDRGYVDFRRLFVFTLCSAFFVVRTKKNVLLQRRYSRPVDRSTGLRSDHTVILTSFNFAQAYPDPLRRVSYFDAERLKFLTNNFTLPALTIAQIYKSRWQVELFFKWIKQHLRIKSFYGTSENAVKRRSGSLSRFTCSLHRPETPRAGSESLPDFTDFQRYAIRKNAHFTGTPAIRQNESPYDPNQLILFDF